MTTTIPPKSARDVGKKPDDPLALEIEIFRLDEVLALLTEIRDALTRTGGRVRIKDG